jgi:hypothetical protein
VTLLLAAGLFGEIGLWRQVVVELGRFPPSAVVLDLDVAVEGGLRAVAASAVFMRADVAVHDVLLASPLQSPYYLALAPFRTRYRLEQLLHHPQLLLSRPHLRLQKRVSLH